MNESSSGKKAFQIVIVSLALILAAQVAVLSLQNRRLKASIRELAQAQRPESLRVGERVPSLALRGETEGAEQARLLFFFSTTCPACQSTSPVWNRLASRLEECLEIAAVSSEEPEQVATYAAARNLVYDTFALRNEMIPTSYKVRQIPQTILVGRDSVVLGVWSGALDEEGGESVERAVESILGVKPPCRGVADTTLLERS